jgi:hypothetical protein
LRDAPHALWGELLGQEVGARVVDEEVQARVTGRDALGEGWHSGCQIGYVGPYRQSNVSRLQNNVKKLSLPLAKDLTESFESRSRGGPTVTRSGGHPTSARISDAILCPSCVLRHPKQTVAPRFARAVAVALPKPDVAPVTRHVLPLRSTALTSDAATARTLDGGAKGGGGGVVTAMILRYVIHALIPMDRSSTKKIFTMFYYRSSLRVPAR